MSNEGITKKEVRIYIADADTNPSTLTSADVILGEINSYDKSGGGEQIDYNDVFGGKIKRRGSREETTLSFELIFNLEDSARWHEMSMVEHSTGVYVPGDTSPKMIAIEVTRGGKKLALAFNNCDNVTFDFNHTADTTREGTIEFTFPYATDSGIYNEQFKKDVSITELQNWSALVIDES